MNGKQINLGPDRKAAYAEWHRLASQDKRSASGPKRVCDLFAQFLAWCEKNRPQSYDWYADRLKEFARTINEGLSVSDLKPHHAEAWIETKRSSGHKLGCLRAINRAFNWGVRQGHIAANPIKYMEKPVAESRAAHVFTEADFNELLSHVKDVQFRDLLIFSRETGCRPQEVVRIEARHLELDQDRCVFPAREAKGKRRDRVIYITPNAKVIAARLSAAHRSGPIFRNMDGNPWHRNNMACRFGRLKAKLGVKYRLYDLRHSFVTNGLKKGVDPITMQHLVGHSSLAMISKVYAHVSQDVEHMRNAATKVYS
jgi:integrase